MEDVLGILVIRTLIRAIGQYTRYFFFKLIGRKKSFKSLSNEIKDDYKHLGLALTQDFLNAVIGGIIFFVIVLIVVSIVFG